MASHGMWYQALTTAVTAAFSRVWRQLRLIIYGQLDTTWMTTSSIKHWWNTGTARHGQSCPARVAGLTGASSLALRLFPPMMSGLWGTPDRALTLRLPP